MQDSVQVSQAQNFQGPCTICNDMSIYLCNMSLVTTKANDFHSFYKKPQNKDKFQCKKQTLKGNYFNQNKILFSIKNKQALLQWLSALSNYYWVASKSAKVIVM